MHAHPLLPCHNSCLIGPDNHTAATDLRDMQTDSPRKSCYILGERPRYMGRRPTPRNTAKIPEDRRGKIEEHNCKYLAKLWTKGCDGQIQIKINADNERGGKRKQQNVRKEREE